MFRQHWHHEKEIDPSLYVLPSRVFHKGSKQVKFQLGEHCVLICNGCHEHGERRLTWAVDTSYECQKYYDVPDEPLDIRDVLKDKRVVNMAEVMDSEDFRYLGKIPKISTKNLEYITYKLTGFVLRDLVTWVDAWESNYGSRRGHYFVNDLYLNLTKKIQGKCCVCKKVNIANIAPFMLTGIHGDHGEEGRKVKEDNPSRLRRFSNIDEINKELSILKGYCCGECHGIESNDLGSWSWKN